VSRLLDSPTGAARVEPAVDLAGGPVGSLEDRITALFSTASGMLDAEQQADRRVTELIEEFLGRINTTTPVELSSLVEGFRSTLIPAEPTPVDSYVDFLTGQVVPHAVNKSTPLCMGQMTSALPYFVRPLTRLVTALNQNMVQVETAKALVPLERQALAMIHRLVYRRDEAFYQSFAQDKESTLGILTLGGTLANLIGLWCARNHALGPDGRFGGAEAEGLVAALRHYGHEGAAVICSEAAHYSFDKAAEMLGLGARNLIKVPTDGRQRIDLVQLKEAIRSCRARRQVILAVVGIAGTTDGGSIDDLTSLAAICRHEGIHLHVDAAWGGPVLFSNRHRHRLDGIEVADSVTIDGHKQLYLPIGTGVVCFRDPRYARVIERNAYYIIRPGSNDLGRRALEGSRPSSALYLHAALSIIGRSGYGRIIDENLRLAGVMASSIKARPELELLSEPELNIVLFRYIPRHLRARLEADQLEAADHDELNQLNSELQEAQWRAGRCFVARTELRHTRYGRSQTVVALRAVLANPATRDEHLKIVLDDILRVASELESRQARSGLAAASPTAARER